MTNPATIIPGARKRFYTTTVGVSLSHAQRDEVLDAFAAHGTFRAAAEAMRAVMLAYCRSDAVRKAFNKWLAEQPRDFDRV